MSGVAHRVGRNAHHAINTFPTFFPREGAFDAGFSGFIASFTKHQGFG